MAVILGVDPGLGKTGFGVIAHPARDSDDGSRGEYISSGIIRLPRAPLPERLRIIHDSLLQVIDEHRPAELAIEEVFVARDARAAIKLGQARGVAILAAVSRDMPVFEYAARSIKQAVVGSGGADKQQVQHMVKTLLALPAAPAEDAADALAAALCHAHTQQSKMRMERREQGTQAGRIGTGTRHARNS